jgi:hypothetical protein
VAIFISASLDAETARKAMQRVLGRPRGSKNNPNRKILPFRQSEVERAIRGVQARGLTVARIDIEPRLGKISVVPGPPLADTGSEG